jgi:PAS domain S-box-containing protein
MRIKEIMSSDPVVLPVSTTIQEAAEIFLQREIDGAVVVNEAGKPVGLFTKTHIYRCVVENKGFHNRVGSLMTHNVRMAGPDEMVESVIHPGIGRLPVASGEKVVGMVTRTDLAKAFYQSYHITVSEMESIIQSTHNMIISVNTTGQIRVFNRAAEILLGVSSQEVKGKHIMDVFPTSRLMDVMRTGRAEPMQKIRLNGRDLISNRSPIRNNNEIIGAVAVLQDISELENISRELRYVKELNEELDAIIESSFDGLYITDGKGVTLRLNKAFERITGVDGEEFLGRNVRDIEKEGIVSESVSSLVLKRREPVTIIQETKSGHTTLATGNPVFDKNGNIIRIVSNVRDITELNRLKQKLEQVEGLNRHYANEIKSLRMQYKGSERFVIHSQPMRKLLEMVIRLAQVESTVLITGESGTGKELIAETIHENSPRHDKNFLKVNCGAIPSDLLESELFGYEAGAFTGARKEGKAGYFELANAGTLFLDEIGDLPLSLQVKLLRVLQSREIMRIGGSTPIKIDVRILTATNRELEKMVAQKQFREDLYYRLNVIPVEVPPLRDHKEDIVPLTAHFLQRFNRQYKLNKQIAGEVIEVFMQHQWPGNVRELENIIERLMVITPREKIEMDDLPSYLGTGIGPEGTQIIVNQILPLKEALDSVEKQILERAYAKYRTTRQIARELQVDASTVVRKAAKHGINTTNHKDL